MSVYETLKKTVFVDTACGSGSLSVPALRLCPFCAEGLSERCGGGDKSIRCGSCKKWYCSVCLREGEPHISKKCHGYYGKCEKRFGSVVFEIQTAENKSKWFIGKKK